MRLSAYNSPRIGDIVQNGFDIRNYTVVEIHDNGEVSIIPIKESFAPALFYPPFTERVRTDTLYFVYRERD